MLLDFHSNELWEESKALLKEHWRQCGRFVDERQLSLYRSLASAVYEVVESIRSTYPFKKSIGGLKGMTYAYDFLWPLYLKEMYSCQTWQWQDFHSEEAIRTHFDLLKKDCLFFLWSADHPITGQKLASNLQEFIERELNERKIFSIRISHFQHRYEESCESFPAFTIRIQNFSDASLAVVEAGQRFRAVSLVESQSPWQRDLVREQIHKIQFLQLEDQERVLKFESLFPGCQYFLPNDERLFDRAVLFFSDINAERLCHGLNQRLGFKAAECTSHCFWGGLNSMRSWWSPSPTQEQMRGLIIFSIEFLRNQNASEILSQVLNEIRSDQSFQ